ncbi:MAG: 30S ribosome-binding factor RbfA [Pseudomonadota bacterium]
MAKRTYESDAGPTQRQLRVGEVVRRALSDALMRGETHEPELDGVSITVTEVRCSPDLKIATAYVMPLGGANGDAMVKALARAKGELRRFIGKATGLKFTPDLRFRLDETFDQFDDTRRLLSDDKVRRDIEAPEGGANGEEA